MSNKKYRPLTEEDMVWFDPKELASLPVGWTSANGCSPVVLMTAHGPVEIAEDPLTRYAERQAER
jgi:hypothetical protein